MEWRDLKTDPPTGKEHAILLFPCKTDCGLLYITSNPHYAIKNGVLNGYTHWAEIEFAPTHAYWTEWQDSVHAQKSLAPFEDETEEVIARRREAAEYISKIYRLNAERKKV